MSKRFVLEDGPTVEVTTRDLAVIIWREYVAGRRTAEEVYRAHLDDFITWQQVVEIVGYEVAHELLGEVA